MRASASRSASGTTTVLAAPATVPTTWKARSAWSVRMSSTWTATAMVWAANPEAERRSLHLQLPGLVGRRRRRWSSNPHRCGHDLDGSLPFASAQLPAPRRLRLLASARPAPAPGTCEPPARRPLAVLRQVALHLASRPQRLAVVQALTCANSNGSSGKTARAVPISAGQSDVTEYC